MDNHVVLFHDRARKVFFALYSEFKHAVATIDRQRDENVFQQQQAMYTNTLKHHLQNIAQETSRHMQQQDQSQKLNVLVEDYLKEFVHKIKSL